SVSCLQKGIRMRRSAWKKSAMIWLKHMASISCARIHCRMARKTITRSRASARSTQLFIGSERMDSGEPWNSLRRFFFRRFYAAWILLSVEPRAGLVPRYLGLSDRPRLLNNSHHSCLFHSQEKRPAVQLDVHLFRNFHPGVWRHTCHGSVDSLARNLLAVGGC